MSLVGCVTGSVETTSTGLSCWKFFPSSRKRLVSAVAMSAVVSEISIDNDSLLPVFFRRTPTDDEDDCGAASGGPPGQQSGGAAKVGVKFNKWEFLKFLSRVLNTDLLIFVFKERERYQQPIALLY